MNKRLFIRILTFTGIALASFSEILSAATIKGHVLDAHTKEALIGSIVASVPDTKLHDVAGLDGSFTIKNVHPGTYTVAAQLLGYVKLEKTVTVNSEDEVVQVEFAMETSSVNTEEIRIVAATDKESDNYARTLEKNSESVINILSAKTMQLMPDVTVGSILQRVSGVTIDRGTNGEGGFVNIRGMEKRYNYTTIEGIKIPSPDNHGRYISMDIFPTELMQRVEVVKSLTPSMEADATGGVMNLVLKDAPAGFFLHANGNIGYSQELFDRSFESFDAKEINPISPQAAHPGLPATVADFPLAPIATKSIQPMPNLGGTVSFGNRFFKDKLGVLVALGYSDVYTGSSSFFVSLDKQANPAPNPNTPVFDDTENRTYSTEEKKANAQLKLDYQFNPKHSLTYYTVYFNKDQDREREYSDKLVSVPVGEESYHWETRVTNQSIYHSKLVGNDTLAKGLYLDWTMAYSLADGAMPDWTTYSSLKGYWDKMTSRWLSNSDVDLSQYINLSYHSKIFGQNFELKTGAMDRNTNRNNNYDEYNFILATLPSNSLYTIYNAHGNPNAFHMVDSLGSLQNPNNYSVHENIWAVYGMGVLDLGKRIQLIGGLRTETTNQVYVTNESQFIVGQNGSKYYSDMLPSGQIKYKLSEKQALRANYFSSITRPDFFEIVPYTLTGEYYDEAGNYNLKHSTANNVDLRYEYFPKPNEQIIVGAFYKNINDPIEYSLTGPPGSISSQYLIPINNPTPATNIGVELVASHTWHHFAVSANYTYTNSQVTTAKLLYYNLPNGQATNKSENETLPLQGQANNIGNLSVDYIDAPSGLRIRLSAVYTGKLIAIDNPDYGLDQWAMPMTRLDLSFDKKISKKYNITLYGKVNNLLNTPYEIRLLDPIPSIYTNSSLLSYIPNQTTTASVLVLKELYGQTYLLGIRYKF